MHPIGTVAELWRYPVKSMRGERLPTASLDPTGMAGDRRYAVVSNAAPTGKPLLTSRERTRMLLYAPTLDPAPIVTTPSGQTLPLPSPELLAALQQDLAAPGATLELEQSPDSPLTDVRPLSLISCATLDFLARELGASFTPQRLRSNLILNLHDPTPFAEEALEGATLQFGRGPDAPVLRILERIPRCRIVTLNPATAETDPALLRYLAKHRQGRAAIYATVLHPGQIDEQTPVFSPDDLA
jgi:uncharacterized protein